MQGLWSRVPDCVRLRGRGFGGDSQASKDLSNRAPAAPRHTSPSSGGTGAGAIFPRSNDENQKALVPKHPEPIGYFASATIGALGAGALIVVGWTAVDRWLRRVEPRKP